MLVFELFRKHNHSRTGVLNETELRDAFNEVLRSYKVQMQVSTNECAALFAEVDDNGDGKITPSELYRSIRRLLFGDSEK